MVAATISSDDRPPAASASSVNTVSRPPLGVSVGVVSVSAVAMAHALEVVIARGGGPVRTRWCRATPGGLACGAPPQGVAD
ncbi:hypothetical protein DQE80_16305, partial [Enterococcus sp. HPCN18]